MSTLEGVSPNLESDGKTVSFAGKEETNKISTVFHNFPSGSTKDYTETEEESFSFGNFSPSKLDEVVGASISSHDVPQENEENNKNKTVEDDARPALSCGEMVSNEVTDVTTSFSRKSSLSHQEKKLPSVASNSCPSVESGPHVDSNVVNVPQLSVKKKTPSATNSNCRQHQGAIDKKIHDEKKVSKAINNVVIPSNTHKNGHSNFNTGSSSSSSGTSSTSGTPRGSGAHSHASSATQSSGNHNNWVRRKTLFHEKSSILACFSRGNIAPPEMLELYGSFCREREPTNKLPEIDDKIKFVPRVVVVDDKSSPEYIYKQALVTFNKLSLQNFDKILDKFLALGVEKEESLYAKIIELIVSKAQLEPTFCDMYVRFCKCVQDRISEVDKQMGDNFREKLLERCREDFEMDRDAAFAQISSREDLNAEEIEEKKYVLKLRYIGHMKFIGELYQYDVVNAKIMHTCIEDLLGSTEEERLVCVCKLLQVIGKKLEDHDIRKKKASKFKNYLESMRAKSEDVASYSSRVRFMFRDVIELHNNHWVARSDVEAASKAHGNKSPDKNIHTQQHASRSRDDLSDPNQDGWSTVSSSKGRKSNIVLNGNNSLGGLYQSSVSPRGVVSAKLGSSSVAYGGKDHRKEGSGSRGFMLSLSASGATNRTAADDARKARDVSTGADLLYLRRICNILSIHWVLFSFSILGSFFRCISYR